MFDYAKLREPFDDNEYEWRAQSCGMNGDQPWAMVLCYVTNRAIQNRLDEVCGPDNWRNEYKEGPGGGVICGLSIWSESKSQWITKWDGAENTAVEKVKGGLSDAMKRAAVQWGIGRLLYNLTEAYAECSKTKKDGWEYAKTKTDVKFWWKPPRLPDWAVRNKPKEKAKPLTQDAPEPKSSVPAMAPDPVPAPDPTAQQMAFVSAVHQHILTKFPNAKINPNLLRDTIYCLKSIYPTDVTKAVATGDWIIKHKGINKVCFKDESAA